MCCLKLFCLLNLVALCTCYKILGLFPHPAPSHVDVFLPIMTGLAEKGHDVTVVSHYNLPEPVQRYKEIVLKFPEVDLTSSVEMSYFKGYRFEQYFNALLLAYFGQKTCHLGLGSAQVQDLIKSDDSYDLIVMEVFNTDCFLPFAHKFKAPVVGLSSCTIMPWTNERFANPMNPAYIPSTNMAYSDHLSFFERVENTLVIVFHKVFYNWFMRALDERLVRIYFGDGVPSLTELTLNTSLILANTHFSLNLPKPLVPASIEIGGVHVKKVKKLPQNLERWINESTHGVIYFSLGSMIKGHTFPEEKRQAFLRAFGRLPQRVLWKWENDTMPGKPENVMIQKWMPQLDILCHSNVKAFISHGGLLGTTEAVHCGVPAVVMPQYGDQHTNARALEASGGGVILKLHEADEEKVYNALRTVLDPDFRKGAQELSARFRDRPLPPLETAIYWVEYVARHRGAHHMRTAAVGMPSYKYFLLDVIAFLLLVSVAISAVFFYIAKAIFRRLFAGRSKVKTN